MRSTLLTLVLFCATGLGQLLFATTYTTIAPGNWQNSSTWQGGQIPDPENLNGHTVIINHDITLVNNNIKVNNFATMTVTGVDFTLLNGDLIIEEGDVVFTNCAVEIAHGFSIQLKKTDSFLEMDGCQVEVGQNFQNSEGLRILRDVCLIVDENFQNAKGTDSLLNVCALIGDSTSGNFQNDSNSDMYILDSEFHLPNGSFQNQSSANLSGTITAIWVENGDLDNQGTWTASVSDYCVSANVTVSSTYLPAAQNCTTIANYFNPCSCGAAAPLALSANTTDPLCFGDLTGGVDLTVSGGTAPFTYSWSNGSTTEDLSNIGAGTYTVTVTDAGGQTATLTVTISQPSAVSASANSTDASCNGGNDGTATASASGGTPPYSYSWSNGASTASISGLAAGTYTVTVTDANGCKASATATVNEPSAVAAAASASDITCNGDKDGTATASASGGTPPYSYSWSNGASTASISGLAAGTYTVTVTDANGCKATATATVNEPSAVSVSINASNAGCSGATDGTATATASGGIAPYSYAWSNGAGTASISGLAAGTYTVTATDANGCTGTENVSITAQGGGPTAEIDCCADVAICAGSSASFDINLSGTGPWTLSYSDGSTTTTVTATSSPYTATVSPGATTTYELVSVTNSCGNGTACGSVTVGVNDCSINSKCANICFSATMVNQVSNGNCITYTMDVTCDGSCASALSNMSVNLPCGTFQSGSTDAGFPVVATNSNGDPNSSLKGFKVDNVNNFCEDGAINTFRLTYTVCYSGSDCGTQTACGPMVAFKAGKCVQYQVAGSGSNVAPAAPLRVAAGPNPFLESTTVEIQNSRGGAGNIHIFDARSADFIHSENLGYLEAGTHRFTWEGSDLSGAPVRDGLYLMRVTVGEEVQVIKLVRQ